MHESETLRLQLRRFTESDLDNLYSIYSNPEVMRYVGKGVLTRQETDTRIERMAQHWQQHGFGMWAVIEKVSQRLIGRCGLIYLDGTPEVELGYVLDKPYWNQGLATEASLACLKFGFEQIGLERIVAIAHPQNIASQRVMQKVGMEYEKDAYYYDTNVVYYVLSRQNWQA